MISGNISKKYNYRFLRIINFLCLSYTGFLITKIILGKETKHIK